MAAENYIKVLTAADQSEYNAMVADSFSTAVGLAAEKSTLVWTPTDNYYTVLGLYVQGQLKSMMRLEWIETETEFKIKVDESHLPFPLSFPVGYLAKAATATDSKNKNYNTLLRYHCLKIFESWKVAMVLGVIATGSPRQKTMVGLGYEFFQKQKKWNGNFKSEREILMGFLKTDENIQFALEKIQTDLKSLILQFPLQFKYQDIPMSGRIRLYFPWTGRAA